MKKYTKPLVVKVELNHEQAVLAACHALATGLSSSDPAGYCVWADIKCKQYSTLTGKEDHAATS